MNYPMNTMSGLVQQPPELSTSYWGNLAQFGLYPNGRGGVAPAPNIGLASSMEQSCLRPQNLAVGKDSTSCLKGFYRKINLLL